MNILGRDFRKGYVDHAYVNTNWFYGSHWKNTLQCLKFVLISLCFLCITFPDSQGSQPANLTNDGDSERRLVFQPSKHALVVDFDDLSFIQYLGFSFKWNSSLSTLQFMVDYSVDGLHWSDYVEDERVKVKGIKVESRFLEPPRERKIVTRNWQVREIGGKIRQKCIQGTD